MEDATSGPAILRRRVRTRDSSSAERGVCGSSAAVVRSLQPGRGAAPEADAAAEAKGGGDAVAPKPLRALRIGEGAGASAAETPSTCASLRALAPS